MSVSRPTHARKRKNVLARFFTLRNFSKMFQNTEIALNLSGKKFIPYFQALLPTIYDSTQLTGYINQKIERHSLCKLQWRCCKGFKILKVKIKS